MNASDLKKILTTNLDDTGIIEAVYTFDQGKDCIVYNDVYATGDQVYTGDFQKPIFELTPGISVGCSTDLINNLSGSGIFNYEDVMRCGDSVSWTSDFTFFIDYTSTVVPEKNVGTILLTTMDSYTGTSGFIFGVNAANKAFFEFFNASGEKQIATSNENLGYSNLMSVSYNSGILNFTNHDIGSLLHKNESFSIDQVIPSTTLHVGNFPSGAASLNYTGFKGSLETLQIFSNGLPLEQQNVIAKGFFETGIQSPYSSGVTITGLAEFTGVNVLTGVVTGSGITGFTPNVYSTLETCTCGDIVFYKESGVSGLFYGTQVEYVSGTGTTSFVVQQEFPAKSFYNDEKAQKYAEQGIVFTPLIKSGSTIEIYSQKQLENFDHFNLDATYIEGNDNWYTVSGYESGNINIYAEGLAQYSGTPLGISNPIGNFCKITEDEINGGQYITFPAPDGGAGRYSGNNQVVFDRITGYQELKTFSGYSLNSISVTRGGSGYTSVPTVVIGSTTSGEGASGTAVTGSGADLNIKVTSITVSSEGSGFIYPPTITLEGGSPTQTATASSSLDTNNIPIVVSGDKDVYLNGYKLISGLNYTQTATQVSLLASSIQEDSRYQTGYNLLLLPRGTGDYFRYTGTTSGDLNFINIDLPLVDELTWVNGKRMINYTKVSNLSLLKKPFYLTGVGSPIYQADVYEATEMSFFNT
jgi:hypothetical protein